MTFCGNINIMIYFNYILNKLTSPRKQHYLLSMVCVQLITYNPSIIGRSKPYPFNTEFLELVKIQSRIPSSEPSQASHFRNQYNCYFHSNLKQNLSTDFATQQSYLAHPSQEMLVKISQCRSNVCSDHPNLHSSTQYL